MYVFVLIHGSSTHWCFPVNSAIPNLPYPLLYNSSPQTQMHAPVSVQHSYTTSTGFPSISFVRFLEFHAPSCPTSLGCTGSLPLLYSSNDAEFIAPVIWLGIHLNWNYVYVLRLSGNNTQICFSSLILFSLFLSPEYRHLLPTNTPALFSFLCVLSQQEFIHLKGFNILSKNTTFKCNLSPAVTPSVIPTCPVQYLAELLCLDTPTQYLFPMYSEWNESFLLYPTTKKWAFQPVWTWSVRTLPPSQAPKPHHPLSTVVGSFLSSVSVDYMMLPPSASAAILIQIFIVYRHFCSR